MYLCDAKGIPERGLDGTYHGTTEVALKRLNGTDGSQAGTTDEYAVCSVLHMPASKIICLVQRNSVDVAVATNFHTVCTGHLETALFKKAAAPLGYF